MFCEIKYSIKNPETTQDSSLLNKELLKVMNDPNENGMSKTYLRMIRGIEDFMKVPSYVAEDHPDRETFDDYMEALEELNMSHIFNPISGEPVLFSDSVGNRFVMNASGERYYLKRMNITETQRQNLIRGLAFEIIHSDDQNVNILKVLNDFFDEKIENLYEAVADLESQLLEYSEEYVKANIDKIEKMTDDVIEMETNAEKLEELRNDKFFMRSVLAGIVHETKGAPIQYDRDVNMELELYEEKDASSEIDKYIRSAEEVRDDSTLDPEIFKLLNTVKDFYYTRDGKPVYKIDEKFGLVLAKPMNEVKNRILEIVVNSVGFKEGSEINPYNVMIEALKDHISDYNDDIIKQFLTNLETLYNAKSPIDKLAFQAKFVKSFLKGDNTYLLTEVVKTEDENRMPVYNFKSVDPSLVQNKRGVVAQNYISTLFYNDALENPELGKFELEIQDGFESKEQVQQLFDILGLEHTPQAVQMLFDNRNNLIKLGSTTSYTLHKLVGDLIDTKVRYIYRRESGEKPLETTIRGAFQMLRDPDVTDSVKRDLKLMLASEAKNTPISILAHVVSETKPSLADSNYNIAGKSRWKYSNVNGYNKLINQWKAGKIDSLRALEHKNLPIVDYLLAKDTVQDGIETLSEDEKSELISKRISKIKLISNAQLREVGGTGAVEFKEVGESDLVYDQMYKMFYHLSEMMQSVKDINNRGESAYYSALNKTILPMNYGADKSTSYGLMGFDSLFADNKMGFDSIKEMFFGELESVYKHGKIIDKLYDKTDLVANNIKLNHDYVTQNLTQDFHFNTNHSDKVVLSESKLGEHYIETKYSYDPVTHKTTVTVYKTEVQEIENNGKKEKKIVVVEDSKNVEYGLNKRLTEVANWKKLGFFNSLVKGNEELFESLFTSMDNTPEGNIRDLAENNSDDNGSTLVSILEVGINEIVDRNLKYYTDPKGIDLSSSQTNIIQSETELGIKRFIMASLVNNMQMFQLFSGDLAFYKQRGDSLSMEDALKRGPAPGTDGLQLLEHDLTTDLDHKYLIGNDTTRTYTTLSGNKVEYNASKQFVRAIVNDIKMDFSKSDAHIKKALEHRQDKREVLEAFKSYAYELADAAGFMTLEHFMLVRAKIYGLTEKDYQIFENLKNPNHIPTEEEIRWTHIAANTHQNLKLVHFENKIIDIEDGLRYTRPEFLKYAPLPLVPSLIKGTEMEILMNKMHEQGVDQVIFKSGAKASNGATTTIHKTKKLNAQAVVIEGVESLFNENPELANSVYETLGLVDELGFKETSKYALSLGEAKFTGVKPFTKSEQAQIDELNNQQKQQAQQLYSQYLKQNPNGTADGFKEFVEKGGIKEVYDGLDHNLVLNPNTLSYNNLKLQVELPTHFDSENTIGTQHVKNLIANLDLANPDKVYPYKGKMLSAQELFNNYSTAIINILESQSAKFLENYGINIVNGQIDYKNDKLRDMLLSQLDINQDYQMINMMKDPNIPLETIPGFGQRLFPVLAGFIHKKVGKIRTNSGSVIQVANVGFDKFSSEEKSDVINLKNDLELKPPIPINVTNLKMSEFDQLDLDQQTTDDYYEYNRLNKLDDITLAERARLQELSEKLSEMTVYYYIDELTGGTIASLKPEIDGQRGVMKINSAQVMMPFASIQKKLNMTWEEFTVAINESKQMWGTKDERSAPISKELFTNIISYRIPNQSISSNDSLEIVGILPPYMGDMAVVYGEITAKTGSDFDVDKLYLMLPSFEARNKGNLKRLILETYLKPGIAITGIESHTIAFEIKEDLKSISDDNTTDISYESLVDLVYNIANNINNYKIDRDLQQQLLDAMQEGVAKGITDNRLVESYKERPEFKTTEIIYSQHGIKGYQNDLIESMAAILQSEATYDDLMSPLDSDLIRDSLYEVLYEQYLDGLKPRKDENSEEDTEESTIQKNVEAQDILTFEEFKKRQVSPLLQASPMMMIKNRVDMLAAKKLVATMANHMTDIAMTQIQNIHTDINFGLGDGNLSKIFMDEYKGHKHGESANDYNTYVRKLTQVVSYFMNAAVDAAKDAYIIDGNFNSYTAGAAMLLIRSGISAKEVFKVLLNPTILEVSKLKKSQTEITTTVDLKALELDDKSMVESMRKYYQFLSERPHLKNNKSFDTLLKEMDGDETLLRGFWQSLVELGKELNLDISTSKYDSSGAGKNISEHISLLGNLKKASHSNIVSTRNGKKVVASKLFKNGIEKGKEIPTEFIEPNSTKISELTFLGMFQNNTINLTKMLAEKMFIEATPGYKHMIERILMLSKNPMNYSETSVKDISNYLYGIVLSYSNQSLYNKSEYYYNNLIENIADQFNMLKSDPFTKDMEFVNQLTLDKFTNKLVFPNGNKFNASDLARMAEEFESIYMHNSTPLKILAIKLIEYAYVTTGFKPTINSYNHLLPKTYFIENGHHASVNKLIEMLNNPMNESTWNEIAEKAYIFSIMNNPRDYRHSKVLNAQKYKIRDNEAIDDPNILKALDKNNDQSFSNFVMTYSKKGKGKSAVYQNKLYIFNRLEEEGPIYTELKIRGFEDDGSTKTEKNFILSDIKSGNIFMDPENNHSITMLTDEAFRHINGNTSNKYYYDYLPITSQIINSLEISDASNKLVTLITDLVKGISNPDEIITKLTSKHRMTKDELLNQWESSETQDIIADIKEAQNC